MRTFDYAREALLYAGFAPPTTKYTKTDPRGPEYGQFDAYPDSNENSIRVVFRSRARSVYWACTFDNLHSFVAWAEEHT